VVMYQLSQLKLLYLEDMGHYLTLSRLRARLAYAQPSLCCLTIAQLGRVRVIGHPRVVIVLGVRTSAALRLAWRMYHYTFAATQLIEL
jgi:hypothetical protein